MEITYAKLRAIIRASVTAGFNVSGEGSNAEHGKTPTNALEHEIDRLSDLYIPLHSASASANSSGADSPAVAVNDGGTPSQDGKVRFDYPAQRESLTIDAAVNQLVRELKSIPDKPTNIEHAAKWAAYHGTRAAFWKSAARLLVATVYPTDRHFIAGTIAQQLELENSPSVAVNDGGTPPLIDKIAAELAFAILRLAHSKDLHNIECLEALAYADMKTFLVAYQERHKS